MSESFLESALENLLQHVAFMREEKGNIEVIDLVDDLMSEEAGLHDVDTFADRNVKTHLMTHKRGLVLRMKDGSEYQVAIIQTKKPGENLFQQCEWCGRDFIETLSSFPNVCSRSCERRLIDHNAALEPVSRRVTPRRPVKEVR